MPFGETLDKIKQELPKEGFGVLSEIDVTKTMANKLHVQIRPYTILGVCNPPFAYQALSIEKEIGLMLPCNIIVYQDDEVVIVAAIKPTVMMTQIGNSKLISIAEQVQEKLTKIIKSL